MAMSHASHASPAESGTRRGISPVIWSVIFFLLIAGILAALIWRFIRPPVVETVSGPPVILADELLQGQQATNQALSDELERLRLALSGDPCDIPAVLGSPMRSRPLRQPGTPASPDSPGSTPPAVGPDSRNADPTPSPEVSTPSPNTAPEAESTADPQTVGDLLEQASVFVMDIVGDSLHSGTGFFIAPGLVLTNRHVVDAGGQLLIINKRLGELTPARVVAISSQNSRDYAVLAIEGEKAATSPYLALNTNAKRTMKVSAWGYPGAVIDGDPQYEALMRGDFSAAPEIVYSEGVISVCFERTPPTINHTSVISQGNSGGPLVNEKGEVLGINTFISMDGKSYRQTGIALASSDIIAFLNENGIAATVVDPQK